jgi:two-component system C4-dicarboxylate transport sensor histidine kinase DctB
MATAWGRRNWVQRQESFSTQLDQQERRLQTIEERLADAQTLADLGAQTARIGHGLKNAVHSLRGFSTLIERGKNTTAGDSAALRGLKDSIDQLEALALESLQPKTPAAEQVNGSSGEEADSDLRELLDTAAKELALGHPEVRCRIVWEEEQPVRVPGRVLSEVLSNLLLNAAESMEHTGEVRIQVVRAGRSWEVQVSDDGPGIAAGMESRIFRPGHSTKASGHGMGLYLSRSLMESLGGALSLASSEAGASFRIALPESRVG